MPLLNMDDECCEKACDDFESKRIPKISDVPDFLDCSYFITGSVKFGCASRRSDLDIAIPIMYKEQIYKPEYKPSNYNAGFKFMYNDVCINMIPLHPLEYIAWNHAAKIISTIQLFKPIEKTGKYVVGYEFMPKYKRLVIHEMYVAATKLAIGHLNINPENFEDYLKL